MYTNEDFAADLWRGGMHLPVDMVSQARMD